MKTIRQPTLSPSRLVPLLLLVSILMMLSCRLVDNLFQTNPADRYDINRDEAIFLLDSQPLTLDPAKTLGGPDGPLGHIFSGLVSLNTDLQPEPDLAAGWQISDDGLIYTFYLYKSATFHDGRPLTAADVIYSWERAVDPDTGSETAQTYLGDIAGVNEKLSGEAVEISGLEAVDEHTLKVRLTAPIVYFLEKLAYPVTFVVDRDNVSQGNWEHHANGSGPFTLRQWEDDEVIILERNDYFYRPPANIKHLVYQLGPGLPLSMYETDQIDAVAVGSSTLERASDPNDPLAADLRTGISMCTSTIGLNSAAPPFSDVRVRQAFNLALDKELLVTAFSGGQSLVAAGALPPGMPGFINRGPVYPFDPERARQLLADAGFPNGEGFPTVTYTSAGYGDVGAYVTAVITLWQDNLNVTVEPVLLDPFIFYDELYAGNSGDVFSSGWCADYPDPQNFLDILYHSGSRQNVGRFSNSSIDALLEQARIEPDIPTRLNLYADIEQMILDEAPAVFLSHSLSAVLVKPRVQGYVLTPIGVPQWHRVSLR